MLRAGLLLWGIYQDSNSAFKYTDIDYFVFTDAARFLYSGVTPYFRATYRYTPFLAWMLLPTSWGGIWFSFAGCTLATAADNALHGALCCGLRCRGATLAAGLARFGLAR